MKARGKQAQLKRLIANLNAHEHAAPGRTAVLNVASQLIELATLLVAAESARFPTHPPEKKQSTGAHHKCLRCGAGPEWLQ